MAAIHHQALTANEGRQLVTRFEITNLVKNKTVQWKHSGSMLEECQKNAWCLRLVLRIAAPSGRYFYSA
jgi:hypothetical protein